jgi:hypothetical protein
MARPAGQPPTTQGELPGELTLADPCRVLEDADRGERGAFEVEQGEVVLGEPTPVPGSHGTPGIQSGAQ